MLSCLQYNPHVYTIVELEKKKGNTHTHDYYLNPFFFFPRQTSFTDLKNLCQILWKLFYQYRCCYTYEDYLNSKLIFQHKFPYISACLCFCFLVKAKIKCIYKGVIKVYLQILIPSPNLEYWYHLYFDTYFDI